MGLAAAPSSHHAQVGSTHASKAKPPPKGCMSQGEAVAFPVPAEPKWDLSAGARCGLAALIHHRNPGLWNGSAQPWPHKRILSPCWDHGVPAAGAVHGQRRQWRWQDITTCWVYGNPQKLGLFVLIQ